MPVTLEPLSPQKQVEAILELAKNTQAGTVLVTTALMDRAIQTLLLTAMRPLSNNVATAIFGDYGPLYETGPKIDIAYGFSLIDEQTYRSLKAVTKIRNAFAHMDRQLTFRSQEILDLCNALPGWKKNSDPYGLFSETVRNCMESVEAKTQKLTYDRAVQDDASPDK
jgi:DNA-binding MltR family transcriptional regulator